ncbi:hypothetical protein M885DRAFT_554283 [Pelagophyceae sp. CCMP2097]|nr:hypothetical protein M885DRAFT_554283 [Pelagophyceae sp. CCMP2097]
MPAAQDRPKTYSNPLGATLTPIRDGVWLAERPFYPRLPGLTGVDVACKSAVLRLRDGGLFVHAPVELDDATKRAIDALGPVKFIVTPNTEHLKYAKQWIEAYPEAKSFACPGLRAKRPDIGFGATVGADEAGSFTTAPPEGWPAEVLFCWMDAEKAPLGLLGNKPFFSEVVFCHVPSKVLFVTDLWWNYPSGDGVPKSSRLWKAGMDMIYKPVYNNLMKIKPTHDARVSRVLAWDFDYMAPCHGEPVEGTTVKAQLAKHLAYPWP